MAHITAADTTELLYGQGYASATKQPCELLDQLITLRSERSRWFGPGPSDQNIESDFGWRAIGLVELAREDYQRTSKKVRQSVDAFAAGWNRKVQATERLDVEGWCRGAPWLRPVTGEDIYLAARAVTLYASSAALLPFLGSAQPPDGSGENAAPPPGELPAFVPGASNGWALGRERTAKAGGMLLANPHFPWVGAQRFQEFHLRLGDGGWLYGGQLAGLPGLAIGFGENVAWTHTVSAGKRFTAYALELAPDDPRVYIKDGARVPLRSKQETIEVLRDDGTLELRSRTLWSSEHGPILNVPGVGWSRTRAVSIRDANIDNNESIAHYLDLLQIGSLEDLQQVHRRHLGVPLFNTIAVSSDGTAWYADTSATPNLSPEALAAYQSRLENDLLTQLAANLGVVLLDGSTSRDDWVEVPNARDPGLVPWEDLPQTTRTDYVFNANDTHEIFHHEARHQRTYSPLHGDLTEPLSARTRENLAVLSDLGASGPAGPDARFDLDELRRVLFEDTGYLVRQWKDQALSRCRQAVATGSSAPNLPEVCAVLERWDGTYRVSSRGAVLWREFLRIGGPDRLWAEGFDPSRAVDTPAGLIEGSGGDDDPVVKALIDASTNLTTLGLPLDVELGAVQIDGRWPDLRLPVPGGLELDGVLNIVGPGRPRLSAEPVPSPVEPRPSSTLDAEGTTRMLAGSSLLLAVEYSKTGPRASSLLVYGSTSDPTDPESTQQMKAFAAGRWRDVLLSERAIRNDSEYRKELIQR